MSQQINLAIIGTGNMGASHAKTFRALDGCTLVAACDVDAALLAAFAKTYAVPHTYPDVDALLSQADVDAVVVATPDHLHAPIALKVIAAGKHILCEKPLAVDYAAARTMAEAAAAAGVIHMVNFSYRRAAALQHAHRLVRDGRIGRVMHVEAAYLQSWLSAKMWGAWRTEPMWLWRLSTRHGSNGVLGDVGVHILDLASYPAGDIRSVHCRLKTFRKAPGDRVGDYVLDANDSAVIMAELEGGALAVIHASRWATGHANTLRLSIHGDRGALRLDLDQSYDTLDVCRGADVDTAAWQTVTCPPTPTNAERFLGGIRTGRNPQPDFARGAAIQRVIDACIASDATGRAVPVPPRDPPA